MPVVFPKPFLGIARQSPRHRRPGTGVRPVAPHGVLQDREDKVHFRSKMACAPISVQVLRPVKLSGSAISSVWRVLASLFNFLAAILRNVVLPKLRAIVRPEE